MLGVPEVAAACTWTLGACPAATDIAEPAMIDPVAPSARIAGMMIARLMRMIPPWRFPEVSRQVARPCRSARRIYVRWSYFQPRRVSCAFLNGEIWRDNRCRFTAEIFK